MKKVIAWAALMLALIPTAARAEEKGYDERIIIELYDTEGDYLTSHSGQVYVDDEYIAEDNRLYRIVETDDDAGRATAEYVGYEPPQNQAAFQIIVRAYAEENQNKRICMYSTHSDESYEPSDGTSSKLEDAGIYDVGNALKENLEKRGIEVTYSKDTFFPHDAGAYRRSRSTAEELLKTAPAALLDLHRDGIPDPSEYEKELSGNEISKVRLLVGRSNANADANRAFAKEIKAEADKKYPGLIKDIYIGKGNYNQELYPKALLMEFGTHTTEKERAVRSTKYVADVLDGVLFGDAAKASEPETNRVAGKGAAWIVGAAIGAALIYALAATGSFKAMGAKIGRGISEMTGGLMGKKPDDKEKK